MSISRTLARVTRAAPTLAILAALGACDANLTDTNVNPNNPASTRPEFLLTQGTTAAVGRALGANFHMTLTALWAQQIAKIQYIDEDKYALRDGTVNTHWAGFYAGPLQDFQDMIRLSQANDNRANYLAAARTMKSWTYATVTDVWGDVPYSEALRGTDGQGITSPAYDPQQAIYNGILTDLAAASQGFTASEEFDGDVLYGGDAAAWRKFANSLRLRYGMRLSQADPTKAREEVAAAVAAGVFTSNADNAMLVYSSIPDNNPIHENQRTRDDHAVSKAMVDTLASLADPRLAVYARPNVEGVFRGRLNGDERVEIDEPINQFSRLGSWFVQPNTPALILTYAEVLFLQAEAAQRGWIAGDAAALYRQGIRASMELFGIPDQQITAYLQQARVQYNPATGLRQIALQKWIALFSNGPEAYAEWRRTDYPQLTVVPSSVNGNVIPVRVPYPSSEQSLNRANLEAAVARNGGMTRNDAVWWDK